MRASWGTDQHSYHPGPEPELQVGPPQQPPYLCTVGAGKVIEPTDPKFQNPHDTGKQEEFLKESH